MADAGHGRIQDCPALYAAAGRGVAAYFANLRALLGIINSYYDTSHNEIYLISNR